MIKSASTMQPAAVASSDPDAARKFAWQTAWENNRDHNGKPFVMLPDGSREIGYRRASSYGAPLEDATTLEKWKLRQVARGIARRDDLRLAVTRAEVGLDGEPDAQQAAKKKLNELSKEAMDAVGSGEKASIGTSLHHVFEMVDLGQDPGHVPDQWQPDLGAYVAVRECFRVLSAEEIVVQDEHMVGGTYDRVLELVRAMEVTNSKGEILAVLPAGEIIIGDVKTSQKMDFAGSKFGIQVWSYATSTPYDPIKKVRIPWPHRPPSQEWAVIIHVASGSGKAGLHWVDLQAYAEAAEEVRRVYEWRNRRGKAGITRGSVIEDFTVTCQYAQTEFDLLAAYQRAVAAGQWNDVLKARFSRRKLELVAPTDVAK